MLILVSTQSERKVDITKYVNVVTNSQEDKGPKLSTQLSVLREQEKKGTYIPNTKKD